MKHRILRVREVVKRELSAIVARDFNFGSALVTIQDVDITADLKQAHVFVSVVGEPAAKERVIAQLESQRPMIQHELSRRVVLKYTPHLHFQLDESIERGSRVLEI